MQTTRQNGPARMRIAWRKAISRGEDDEGAFDRRIGKSRPDPRTHVSRPGGHTGNSGCSGSAGFEKGSALYRGIYSGPVEADGYIACLRLHRAHSRLARYPRKSRREKFVRFL